MADFPTFIGPTYTTASRRVGIERCVNLYPERAEGSGSKVPWWLRPIPGPRTAVAGGAFSPGRGIFTVPFSTGPRVFLVLAHVLYEMLGNHSLVARGTVASDERPVIFRTNGDAADQLLICSGDQAYLYDLTLNTLTTVLISGADAIDYLDGYFLSLDDQLAAFRLSNLLNGGTWSLLQQQQRIASPDPWIMFRVVNGNVWLFGTDTSDVWYNSGASPFPFEPIPNARMEWGIAAAHSVGVIESPIWLARNKDGVFGILQASGYAPVRISNHSVETAIGQYARTTRIDDAEAYTYSQDGHTFYVLTFPTAQATWVYDASTKLWHERMYRDPITGQERRYRPRQHAAAWGRNYVLDWESGAVLYLDPTYHFDVGDTPLRRIRRSPHVQSGAGRKQQTCSYFCVDLDVGLGLQTGQGSDPVVELRVSGDSGHTYSPVYAAPAGRAGEYDTLVDWFMLGDGDSFVFEVSMSDPIPWRLIGAAAEIH